MTVISKLQGREILDSRGFPTVEVDVILDTGEIGRAAVPSGASTGSYEAIEKRDLDPKRYFGKGVLNTLRTVTEVIEPAVRGKNPMAQQELDALLINLDATPNKKNLGANIILAVSLAVAKAAACAQKKPLYRSLRQHDRYRLPMPLMNVLNGGAHANNSLDFQEFMIVPVGATSLQHAVQMGAEVFQSLKQILQQMGHSTAVGDEGGFAPNLSSANEALDCLCKAITKAGYAVGTDVAFALDVAANEFFSENTYYLKSEKKRYDAEQLLSYYKSLVEAYPIVSIEDGFGEDDFKGWAAMTQELGAHLQIVGDDLFVTNPQRLKLGMEQKLANAILIKLNQIGTLSETLETIAIAQQNHYNCVISHRSGETEDTTIADLAVATNSGQIKTGSLSRSERICKYNQLIRIEQELGAQGYFESPFPKVVAGSVTHKMPA